MRRRGIEAESHKSSNGNDSIPGRKRPLSIANDYDIRKTDNWTIGNRYVTPAEGCWSAIVGGFYNKRVVDELFISNVYNFTGSVAFAYINYAGYYFKGIDPKFAHSEAPITVPTGTQLLIVPDLKAHVHVTYAFPITWMNAERPEGSWWVSRCALETSMPTVSGV